MYVLVFLIGPCAILNFTCMSIWRVQFFTENVTHRCGGNLCESRCYDFVSVSYTHLDLKRELYAEEETELYELNRKYDEWKIRLEVCLHNNDLIDETKVNNLIMNIITDGDLTDVLNRCV